MRIKNNIAKIPTKVRKNIKKNVLFIGDRLKDLSWKKDDKYSQMMNVINYDSGRIYYFDICTDDESSELKHKRIPMREVYKKYDK